MKYIIFLLLLLTLVFSCAEKNEKFVPEKFEIEQIEVELPYDIKDIIQYGKGYVFSTNWYDTAFFIGYLDKNFKIDQKFTQLLQEDNEEFKAIWSIGDTLFAITGTFPNYKKVFWQKAHWRFVESITESRENAFSYELNYPIFEDEEFIVRSCCCGEFGGSIFFIDKKTGKIYSCEATCLNGIQKLEGSYYVTSSLSHGVGFCRVIKIDNPRKLYEIKNKKQLQDCSWYNIYPENSMDLNYEIDHPKGYDKGYQTLIDTFEITIAGAFVYKKHIYHIYTDGKNTYLGYINNKKFVHIDTLLNKTAMINNVRDLKNNSNILPIKSSDFNGAILLKGKKIKIVEFKKTKSKGQLSTD